MIRFRRARQETLDLEREALDLTIKWAYQRGARDASARHDLDMGQETAVIEFRSIWGNDRRETTR